MIRSARHTGLVVRDLERSLAFYRDALGLSLTARAAESGPFIEAVVGIPGVRLEWAKLRTPDGHIIELLQYHSHPEDGVDGDIGRANRLGCSHVAFTVDEIGRLHSELVRLGFRVNSAPQASPDGRCRVMYAHDPDGIILEFVEEINR
ncbi:MAG: VOC family protein [Elusimicrobiota bacterium]